MADGTGQLERTFGDSEQGGRWGGSTTTPGAIELGSAAHAQRHRTTLGTGQLYRQHNRPIRKRATLHAGDWLGVWSSGGEELRPQTRRHPCRPSRGEVLLTG